jgi:hypothetical protein
VGATVEAQEAILGAALLTHLPGETGGAEPRVAGAVVEDEHDGGGGVVGLRVGRVAVDAELPVGRDSDEQRILETVGGGERRILAGSGESGWRLRLRLRVGVGVDEHAGGGEGRKWESTRGKGLKT